MMHAKSSLFEYLFDILIAELNKKHSIGPSDGLVACEIECHDKV